MGRLERRLDMRIASRGNDRERTTAACQTGAAPLEADGPLAGDGQAGHPYLWETR